jgi:uncharacterized protein YecE (DUF72 family)
VLAAVYPLEALRAMAGLPPGVPVRIIGAMPVWIGTSGWQYASWRGGIYPEKLPQRLWLEHYVERFDIVEVNNTFYHLPDAEVFAHWRERTPARFRMALKLSRYLSHIKRLREPEEPVSRFLEHARPLGSRTGPLLLQLPPRFTVDVERLRDTLRQIPRRHRVAFEVRDASWFCDAVYEVLAERDAALVLTDRGETRLEPAHPPTASWAYVRLHEGRSSPPTCYHPRRLRAWAEELSRAWTPEDDVYVFFNNDPHGCAVRDAVRFAEECAALGMRPTRVPDIAEARLT